MYNYLFSWEQSSTGNSKKKTKQMGEDVKQRASQISTEIHEMRSPDAQESRSSFSEVALQAGSARYQALESVFTGMRSCNILELSMRAVPSDVEPSTGAAVAPAQLKLHLEALSVHRAGAEAPLSTRPDECKQVAAQCGLESILAYFLSDGLQINLAVLKSYLHALEDLSSALKKNSRYQFRDSSLVLLHDSFGNSQDAKVCLLERSDAKTHNKPTTTPANAVMLKAVGSLVEALLHLQDLHANDKLGNICFDSVMRCQVPKESTCPSSALDTASTRRCTHTTMLATNADNWSHSYTSSSPGPSIESDQEYSDSGVSGTTADRISNSRFASVASKQWPQLQASGFSVNSQTGTWCSMFSADASTLWSPSWFFGNHSVSLRDESVRN